ncbi:MAG: hypothetical protein RXQ75_10245 [Acidianus hospitalis]
MSSHQLGRSSIKTTSVILYKHYLIKTIFRLKITSSYVEALQSMAEILPSLSLYILTIASWVSTEKVNGENFIEIPLSLSMIISYDCEFIVLPTHI